MKWKREAKGKKCQFYVMEMLETVRKECRAADHLLDVIERRCASVAYVASSTDQR